MLTILFVFTEILTIGTLCIISSLCLNNYQTNTNVFQDILNMSIFTTSAIARHGFILYFGYLFALVISIGMIQFKIILLKLKQLNQYLNKAKTHNCFQRVTKYHVHVEEVMRYFYEYNKLYGQIFMLFVLINYPTNAYYLIYIIFGSPPVIARIYLYSYCATQMVCLFVAHLYLVQFSIHFHCAGFILLNLMARNQHKIGYFRRKMFFANLIAAIHTPNYR